MFLYICCHAGLEAERLCAGRSVRRQDCDREGFEENCVKVLEHVRLREVVTTYTSRWCLSADVR